MSLTQKFVGDRKFYRTVLGVAVPMMIQNGITNLVNLLDNVMVGSLSTEAMSGVSIVNQFIFIFNLLVFGAVSAAGIFTAQYHGLGDNEGVRYTFRFKFLVSIALCVAALLLFLLAGDPLIRLYLHEGGETGDIDATFRYAREYLAISLLGLVPYTLTQIYASTLREVGHTVPPMTAGIIGVFVNLALNYLLIFGALGFPKMGVEGAALATVISRFVECIIVVLWTHLHTDQCEFIKDVYASFRVPRALVRKITVTGTPLLLNEALWAAGQAMLLQCYSLRGIAAVSAMNITTTVFNTFSVIYLSIGTAISILIGHRLGAGEKDTALSDARKMIAFAGLMGLAAGALIAVSAPFFPMIYNTTDEVRAMATRLTLVIAAFAPFHAILNSCYFTLRSGGKTILTFFFDCAYVWGINIPTVLALTYLTPFSTAQIYLACHLTELIKWVIGIVLVEKGVWLNDMTAQENQQKEATS